MTNQIILFGAESAKDDYDKWSFASFDDGHVAYRLDGGGTADGESARAVVDRLRQQLAGAAGVAVAITQGPDGVPVVRTLTGKGKRIGPKNIMQVTFAGTRALLPIGDGPPQPLAQWDAVIVPASQAVEKTLERFMQAAQDLPPSTRAAVVFQLVLPTLESRVSRLEQLDTHAFRLGQLAPAKTGWSPRARLVAAGLVFALLAVGLIGWLKLTRQLDVIEQQFLASSSSAEVLETKDSDPVKTPANDEPGKVSRPLPGGPTLSVDKGSMEDRLIDALVAARLESFSLTAVQITRGTSDSSQTATGPQLSTVAQILRAYPTARVEVTGGSLGDGSALERATAIRTALVADGAQSSRVKPVAALGERSRARAGDEIVHPAVRIVSYK